MMPGDRPLALDADAVSRVASRVEILNVELVGAHFDRRDAGVLPLDVPATATPDFAISVAWDLSEDSGTLGCLLGFTGLFEEPAPYSIVAQFRLTYSVRRGEGLAAADFEQFAYWNAVFNAWPYWREYMSNVIDRARLPRVSVPVMGLPVAEPADAG